MDWGITEVLVSDLLLLLYKSEWKGNDDTSTKMHSSSEARGHPLLEDYLYHQNRYRILIFFLHVVQHDGEVTNRLCVQMLIPTLAWYSHLSWGMWNQTNLCPSLCQTMFSPSLLSMKSFLRLEITHNCQQNLRFFGRFYSRDKRLCHRYIDCFLQEQGLSMPEISEENGIQMHGICPKELWHDVLFVPSKCTVHLVLWFQWFMK